MNLFPAAFRVYGDGDQLDALRLVAKEFRCEEMSDAMAAHGISHVRARYVADSYEERHWLVELRWASEPWMHPECDTTHL